MITLYGVPMSLYTGEVRSYLIKNRIPYEEFAPSLGRYSTEIIPKANGLSLPTIDAEDRTVIRDGTA